VDNSQRQDNNNTLSFCSLQARRKEASCLLVLLGLGTLDLGGTGKSLLSVLALLACFIASVYATTRKEKER
jgi:hypothetical protein